MKQRRFAKVLSWILAALLIISLLPSSVLQARAEEGEATAHAWEWTRLAGKNRYQTATLATQEVYKEDGSCEEIIIASGQAFPDALSGSALAGALGCPILLTNKTKLSPDTKTELQRIAAEGCTVYILGGNGAVSAGVEAEINNLGIKGLTTERVKGSNREGTAKAVYEKGGFPEGCTIIVATGYAYADVLSISPYAYAAKAPVILAKKDGSLSAETKELISETIKPGKAIVIGGSKAVSADTEDYLKEIAGEDNVMRLSGSNRYITSAEIMKWELGLKTDAPFQPEVEMHADGMGVATGTNFADALGATSLLGKIASPLLLVADNNKNNAAATETNINELVAPFAADMTKGYIFGGRGAVSEQIQEWLNAVVPAVEEKIYTVDEIREVMKDFTDRQVSDKEYTVRGVVTSSSYKSNYNSYTVWLQSDDGTTARAFELYSVGMDESITDDYTASNALVGKIVTCKGYLQLYGTTYEMPFLNASLSPTGEAYTPNIIKVEDGEAPPEPGEDLVEDKEYTVDGVLAAMVNYIEGQTSAVECTVTGVATSSSYKEKYSSYDIWLQSDDGTNPQAFQLYSVALDASIEGDYTAADALAGKTVTCRGYVKVYDGKYEMPYLGADSSPTGEAYTPLVTKVEGGEQPPEVTDQDKVDYEAGKLSLQTLYTQETVVTLPTPEKYEDVQIVWASDSEFAVIDQEAGTMTITLPEEGEVTANVTATLSLGTATPAEQAFVLTIRNPGDEEVLTVDEILAIMADYTSGQISEVEYVVRGVVTSSSYKSNYNSYTIWLQNNDGTTAKAFELYSVGLDESITDDYTASNALVGKIVTCRGYVQLYNTTYEMPFLNASLSPTGEAYTPTVILVEDGEAPPEPGEDLVEDKEYSVDGVLAAMANYIEGQTSAVECTVTGVATSSSYNSKYSSYTIWLQNDDGSVAEAFQLYSVTLADGIEGDYTAENALAGKTVTCRGYVKVYDGKYEMPYLGAESSPTGEAYTPVVTNVTGGEEPPVFEDLVEDKEYTVDELLAAMANYPDGYVSAVECTVTGVASSSSYNSRYSSYTVWLKSNDGTVEQAFELYSAKLGEGIEGDWTADDAFKDCTVTCRGYVKLYGTTYEMAYISATDSSPVISSIVEPERTPQEKVDYEKEHLTLQEVYTEAGVVELPKPQKYDEVDISWGSACDNAFIDDDAKTMTITLPEGEDVTGQIVATLSLGTTEAYAQVIFNITIKAPLTGGIVWTKVAFADIQDGDLIAITATYQGTTWAMSTTEVSSKSCPMGVVVELSGNTFATEEIEGYGFTAGTVGNNRSFLVYESDKYLYCTNANDGVRIGSPQNAETVAFTIDQDYLYNVAQSRYLGVYRTNPDWRCYTTVNNNITGETIEFWKGEAGAEPELTEQEKVDYEANALTLPDVVTEAGTITLPTPSKYDEVQIAWASDSDYAVLDTTAGTLTFTLPETEDVTANVTATLSLGGASVPKNFAILIKVPAPVPEDVTWTKVAWDDIADGDVIAITAAFEGTTWVLSTVETGSNSQPLGVVVEPADNAFTTQGAAGYGFTAGTVEGGRSFLVYDTEGRYLFCVADNNGVRLGNSEEIAFTLVDGYLYHVGQARYLGVYRRNVDWRCYTSINTNIAGETIEFWKADLGGEQPPVGPTDQEKVDEEKAALELQEEPLGELVFAEDAEITLPGPKTYPEVQIAWESDAKNVVVDDGKLVITQIEEEVIANVTATLTLNEASAEKTFVITVKAKPGDEPETAVWTKVAWEDITEEDTIAITMTKTGTYAGTYVLTSDLTAAGGPPAATTTVTPENGKFETEDDGKYAWVLVPTEGGYYLKRGDDPDQYLYMNDTNNGVRIGTLEAAGDGALLTLDETSGYLRAVAYERYLGVYNAQDWRCYSAPTASNIANQTLEFWKFGEGGEEPPVQLTDEEKVDAEKETLALTEDGAAAFTVEADTEITLPAPKTYTDVQIAWLSDAENVVVTDGKLDITQVATDVVANVTATLSLNEASAEKTFVITVKAKGETPSGYTWTKVAWEDITADDVIAITSTNSAGVWAMSTTNLGTQGQPLVAAVTLKGDYFVTETIEGFGLIRGVAEDGFTFQVYGDAEKYLYCTNTNNGVKFGTGTATSFVLEGDYLKNVGTSRYLGVYSSTDWRCYTSSSTNIGSQVTEFWKLSN